MYAQSQSPFNKLDTDLGSAFFCRAYVVNCEDGTTAHGPSSLPYTVLDATDLIAKDANGEDSLPLIDCAL